MKKLFLLSVLMLLPMLASADAVEINGIYYNLFEGDIAEVTKKPNNGKYSGSIVIPESVEYESKTYSVTSIGDYAFYGCSRLASVTIGKSVTSIGESAFFLCSSLTSIKVESDNPKYDSRDNCNAIIETSSNTLIVGCKTTTIPNSVTSIGQKAFYCCSGLTFLTIPNSVTSISEKAFYECSGLTSVISEIQDPFSIDDNVFNGISRNAKLQVPTGTKSKYKAFSGWTKNFKEIVETEMNNTSTKRTIHVATAGTLPNLISEEEKYMIEELTLTGELNGTDFRLLRDMAGNNYLGQITEGRLTVLDLSKAKIVAGGEKYLDTDFIFLDRRGSYFGALLHISISNNNQFPEIAFCGCRLKIVNIPYSVITIGYGAFRYCRSLTSVTIPNSVTSIGESAFEKCDSLTSVISEIVEPYTIPASVFSDKTYTDGRLIVPSGCKAAYRRLESWNKFANIIEKGSIERIVVDGIKYNLYLETNQAEVSQGNCSDNIIIPENITYGGINYPVTSIEFCAFMNCSDLTSVTIPNSVTSIGRSAFCGCSNLTSVTIPNSVTCIENNTFDGCHSLTSVTIPNSVTSIGDMAFYFCYGLTSVTIGNSVTSINHDAFMYCYGLTSLTIPKSVTSIGNHAFLYCRGLTSINVESGNPNYDSRDNCNAIIETSSNTLLFGCKNTIIPNSVTSISDAAFMNCYGLTSVTIPNSVTSIGDDAFSGCSGLTSLTIPNSVTYIGSWAFSGCYSLTSIMVESGNPNYDSRNNCNAIIETLSNRLITGCMNTIIPHSVISIGDNAFAYCSGLTSVTIPNSVTSIGKDAFYGCSGLTEVKSMIQEPYEIDQNCWKNVNTDVIPLYVPKGTKEKYKATAGWNVFKNITETDDLLDSIGENGGVDFSGEDGPDEDSNLDGNVIGNIYYSIDNNNGEYSSEEGCIILKKPTSDEEMENLEGQDIFGEDFNENFTGIVFMVSAGSGTIKVNAESVGNMTLKVKIGDGAPMTFELEGKMKASFPYSVTEPTYVYIYGGETDSNNARSVRRIGENALKIYGIEWTNDPSGIDDIRVNTKAVIYTINGQRVQTPGKGLYIMNGKKVVMK